MRQVRYQIFISSTFRDLQDERQAVLDAILNMNCFPAGMELFPASNATPWDVIERVIKDSDYYVLIVGGMYGSTDSSGISYTEREYDYARLQGVPVLAFLHKNPDAIPAGKVEMEPTARESLGRFRDKVQQHHCKYWGDARELQYLVAISLMQEINRNPAIGWVRGGETSTEELLRRIDALTQENDRLQRSIQSQQIFRPSSDRSITSTRRTSSRAGPLKLFYSYAHEDELLKNELDKHLSLLKRNGIIDGWHYRRISAGSDWENEISNLLEAADIIVFLLSPDFLSSNYCYDAEVARAFERARAGEAMVIPVILRPVAWESTPFSALQSLPVNGRPVTTWANMDEAFTSIANGIRTAADSMRLEAES